MRSLKGLLRRLKKGTRLWKDPVYRIGLRHGVGAAIEHEAALRLLGVRSVVDVGANKGQFTLLMRGLFPEAVIHAFEPLREAAATFEKLFADDGATTLNQYALGEFTGSADFYISGQSDSSSILPITDRQEKWAPGTRATETRQVLVKRGDEVILPLHLPRPLLIKLDVQGYELAALEGMPVTLRTTDYVCVEISFTEFYLGQPHADDIISFLRGRGFRLLEIYNLSIGQHGKVVQADALFRLEGAQDGSQKGQ